MNDKPLDDAEQTKTDAVSSAARAGERAIRPMYQDGAIHGAARSAFYRALQFASEVREASCRRERDHIEGQFLTDCVRQFEAFGAHRNVEIELLRAEVIRLRNLCVEPLFIMKR